MDDELFFFEEHEDSAEEYLEALAVLEQEGRSPATITDVARKLRVKAPSAVQMLRRIAARGHVTYFPHRGVRLTRTGRRIGMRMVRNGRLMEVFITDTLGLPLDIRLAHTVEHSMTPTFADALCGFLGHPRECPHGYQLPRGPCCPAP